MRLRRQKKAYASEDVSRKAALSPQLFKDFQLVWNTDVEHDLKLKKDLHSRRSGFGIRNPEKMKGTANLAKPSRSSWSFWSHFGQLSEF